MLCQPDHILWTNAACAGLGKSRGGVGELEAKLSLGSRRFYRGTSKNRQTFQLSKYFGMAVEDSGPWERTVPKLLASTAIHAGAAWCIGYP